MHSVVSEWGRFRSEAKGHAIHNNGQAFAIKPEGPERRPTWPYRAVVGLSVPQLFGNILNPSAVIRVRRSLLAP
jgi:hypothetical protein